MCARARRNGVSRDRRTRRFVSGVTRGGAGKRARHRSARRRHGSPPAGRQRGRAEPDDLARAQHASGARVARREAGPEAERRGPRGDRAGDRASTTHEVASRWGGQLATAESPTASSASSTWCGWSGTASVPQREYPGSTADPPAETWFMSCAATTSRGSTRSRSTAWWGPSTI